MPIDDSADWNLGGRYTLHGEIAAGGMATVHIGRMKGTAGFSKVVAIKRLHAQYAKDPDFVSMFLDEARLAARIHHPNVVQTLDVLATEGEVFLVMEYIRGESLSKILRALVPRDERMPLKIAAAVMVGVLHGLHAAHEASNERGEKLGIVHRDMSPQNVLVGPDGIARVLDFGIAKAESRSYQTRDGDLKGKLAYMAPEQLTGEIAVDRRTDIFAASIVLWEILTGRRLFDSDYQSAILRRIRETEVAAPSSFAPDLPPQLDELVLKGLARDPDNRFATARDMAIALEMCLPLATPSKVGEWVESVAAAALSARSARIAEIEKGLAPDVVEESKGILEELRLEGKGKHTKIERSSRPSQIDGREAARTPAPLQSSRASIPDVAKPPSPAKPQTWSGPPPPPPSQEKPARPRDELLPETQEANIVDLSSDELRTSNTGAINAGMLANIRAATQQPQGQQQVPIPQRHSTLPSQGQPAPQRRPSIPPPLRASIPPPNAPPSSPQAGFHDIPPPSTGAPPNTGKVANTGSWSALTPAPPSRGMYEEDVR
ncbi:MAG TPA: serine/threonine-protein kinase, partial [Polyangiaceae bacterium]